MSMGEDKPPTTAEIEKHRLIDEMLRVRADLERVLKTSRERSLVATKLDEAIMWAARAEAL